MTDSLFAKKLLIFWFQSIPFIYVPVEVTCTIYSVVSKGEAVFVQAVFYLQQNSTHRGAFVWNGDVIYIQMHVWRVQSELCLFLFRLGTSHWIVAYLVWQHCTDFLLYSSTLFCLQLAGEGATITWKMSCSGNKGADQESNKANHHYIERHW